MQGTSQPLFFCGTVYIYMSKFSTYAMSSTDAGGPTMGSDMIAYSSNATVGLADKPISMYYRHDASSTNDARPALPERPRRQ